MLVATLRKTRNRTIKISINIRKYPYLRLFAIYIAMSEGILQAEGR